MIRNYLYYQIIFVAFKREKRAWYNNIGIYVLYLFILLKHNELSIGIIIGIALLKWPKHDVVIVIIVVLS